MLEVGGDAPPGEVGFCRIERRKRTPQGPQTEAASQTPALVAALTDLPLSLRSKGRGAWQVTTTDTEITLLGLERGVEHGFCVIAVNAAGDSIPSNVVTVVL